MNRSEIQQRHQLGAIAPVLSDVAACLRESSPFHSLNVAYDAVQAARQLGRNEGWHEAARFVQEIHVAPQTAEKKPVANYSQPANPQPTEKQ